jgi:hypothetical protein
VRAQVASGEIDVPVEIELGGQGESRRHRFFPPQATEGPHGLSLVDHQPFRFGSRVL